MIDLAACRAFSERYVEARMLSSQPLELDRPTPILRYEAQECDRRPSAPSRDPCRCCNIRGDVGCEHQRPYEPHSLAFVQPPGERRQRRRYDRRAFGAGA